MKGTNTKKGGDYMITKKKRAGHLKLRGLMAENNYSISTLSTRADMTPATLGNKLGGYSPFTVPEIKRIAEVFGLSDEDIIKYFFRED